MVELGANGGTILFNEAKLVTAPANLQEYGHGCYMVCAVRRFGFCIGKTV